MKTIFKIGNVEFEGMKINDLTIENEYTASDVTKLFVDGKDFVFKLLKEIPTALEDMANAQGVFDVLDDKFNPKNDFFTDGEDGVRIRFHISICKKAMAVYEDANVAERVVYRQDVEEHYKKARELYLSLKRTTSEYIESELLHIFEFITGGEI